MINEINTQTVAEKKLATIIKNTNEAALNLSPSPRQRVRDLYRMIHLQTPVIDCVAG